MLQSCSFHSNRAKRLQVAAVLIAFLHLSTADRQFDCPNGGQPKVDDKGAPVQCLPGHSAESACGRGHSCFFSGLQYACCPTAEEDYDDATAGCPQGTLAVLDSTGTSVKCSNGNKCQSPGAFCYIKFPTAICCVSHSEAAEVKNYADSDVKASPLRPAYIDTDAPSATPSDSQAVSDFLDCPSNSLTVLNGDGDPLTCIAGEKCPKDNMFCHGIGTQYICCENLASARDTWRDSGDATLNPLKYNPTGATRTTDLSEIEHETDHTTANLTEIPSTRITTESTTTTTETPSTTQRELPTTTVKTAKIVKKQYADNEGSFFVEEKVKVPQRKIQDNHVHGAKAQAAKLVQQEPEAANVQRSLEETLEYRPHALGGYAVSKKLHGTQTQPQRPDKKLLTQKYLLEQIKNGWPYDEKFYRSETVAVLRKGARPAAVVHFPNK